MLDSSNVSSSPFSISSLLLLFLFLFFCNLLLCFQTTTAVFLLCCSSSLCTESCSSSRCVASPLQQTKKSPETKTFPIPKRKEKSTRTEHPKTNNSGKAANTKRQSKLPKTNLWVFVFSHKQKHFVLMGFAQ